MALAVLLARRGEGKEVIANEVSECFGYQLNRSADEIRGEYSFDVSCQGSVPQALVSFLDGSSLEDAIRTAVSLGGDSDTQACIAGGVAEAHYGAVPRELAEEVKRRLPEDLLEVVDEFYQRYELQLPY